MAKTIGGASAEGERCERRSRSDDGLAVDNGEVVMCRRVEDSVTLVTEEPSLYFGECVHGDPLIELEVNQRDADPIGRTTVFWSAPNNRQRN